MDDTFATRVAELQRRLADDGLDAALLGDPDTIYYLTGYWGYLGTEFGRPTLLFVPRAGDCTLVTPLMESDMARAMTRLADIRPWEDGVGAEWRAPLDALLGAGGGLRLGVERLLVPALVAEHLRAAHGGLALADASRLLAGMRMIKSAGELAVMRQAGQVAVAMAEAAEAVIGEGVPEYEVALAVIAGGTRKAAELLDRTASRAGAERFFSPTIHNLQILQSGHDTCLVHRRSTVRRIERGDPVYLCFCGIANFKLCKLGFDREYFVGGVTDEQARSYETTLAAQRAALDQIRPGVPAERVHAAAEAVYRQAGCAPGYRTGRAIGYSFLESPELKAGDKTPLRPGMTFAVDGGITVAGRFGTRVGDSIAVTETGYEVLTPHPKELRVL
jgi:Xaa-Pro aminopeptidase